ncbi:MAG: T9SS type A sorting domain-containing protein, partial [Paludibacteraceae bacterium]|nr:T9SS type A sorting domain-containing protein [Paludibacteraceae bacterium]
FSGGSDGWKGVNKNFTIKSEDVGGVDEVTITMKVKHNDVVFGETRDYAIDNIFFAVCTPPDIAIDYSLNTNKDLLDLNTKDVLTLNAVTSDAMSKFYTYTNGKSDPSKKIGYVYQYTFQDPSTETEINRIKWHTIHKEEVVETKSFDVEFEKYWDEISSNMTDNADLIYFRVVAGEYSDLIADQSWKKHSALSPCRKVSISYIPVAAKVNYVPSTTMTYLYYDDFGKFVSDSIYEWTDNNREIHTEQIPAGQTHTSQSISNIKIPYVKAYYLENSGATLAVPLIGTDPKKTELYNHGAYAVSAHGAYPGGVKYDNSGTQNGGMLQFDLLDDGSQDEFFKVDFDHICTDQEIAFGVDFASISLHPGSIEVKLECNGKTLVSKTASVSEGSDGWKSVNGKFTLNAEDVDGAAEATVTMKIINTLSTTTGEGRDYAIDNIYFAVAGLNCGATTCKDIKNTVDNTNKIEYYKKDAKKDSLKSLDQQNDAVFKAALATTGYTLKIGIVEDATEATAPDLKSAKLGDASSIIPTPTVKDVDSKDDEYLWYYTYLESAEGCVSDTVLVGVIINGEETSLKDTPAKAVSIAPNPASTKISVIAEEVLEKVEILNMVGEVVKVSNRKDIDTSNLSNGVYFVRTTVNDETTVHKLVINK